jgi:hypothetical protein
MILAVLLNISKGAALGEILLLSHGLFILISAAVHEAFDIFRGETEYYFFFY